MVFLYDLSLAELTEFCAGLGEKPFRARQLYSWLYGKGVNDFSQMTDVPVSAREKLAANARADGLALSGTVSSSDGQTTKHLFGTDDAGFIETVFMKYEGRNSVCISTQAGCRMGCRFCASGMDGLVRNLSPSEMALQVILSERAAGARIKNIVLMGVGEPLDNYSNVKKFIENITDDHGRDLSRRAITISTCGLVPGIDRLAVELPQVNLAVSLHAPNDRLRGEIMPVTKRYGVREVVEAVERHYQATHRRPTFEYALIKGFNDGPGHARELAGLLRGMNCLVNLIPLNPPGASRGAGMAAPGEAGMAAPGQNGFTRMQGAEHMDQQTGSGAETAERFREELGQRGIPANQQTGSGAEAAERFRDELGQRGIPATVRRSLGADIDAACGQLRLRKTGIAEV